MYGALLHADVRNHAAVRVIVGVKDQGAQRRVVVRLRRGDELHDLLHDRRDVDALLRGDRGRVLGGNADDVLDLLADALGVRAGQVDLVHDGHNLQPRVNGEVGVGERLRLDALRRVHDEHGSLARREAARDLVVEVDVAGRVDQVEHIVLAVLGMVDERHGVRLDGDAALALELHVVEQLILHVAERHRLRLLQNAVRQRALAVVNMCNDAEISDSVLRKTQVCTASFPQPLNFNLNI